MASEYEALPSSESFSLWGTETPALDPSLWLSRESPSLEILSLYRGSAYGASVYGASAYDSSLYGASIYWASDYGAPACGASPYGPHKMVMLMVINGN